MLYTRRTVNQEIYSTARHGALLFHESGVFLLCVCVCNVHWRMFFILNFSLAQTNIKKKTTLLNGCCRLYLLVSCCLEMIYQPAGVKLHIIIIRCVTLTCKFICQEWLFTFILHLNVFWWIMHYLISEIDSSVHFTHGAESSKLTLRIVNNIVIVDHFRSAIFIIIVIIKKVVIACVYIILELSFRTFNHLSLGTFLHCLWSRRFGIISSDHVTCSHVSLLYLVRRNLIKEFH